MARLRSIHVGKPEYDGWAAEFDGTSIHKRPIEGPVLATAYGLEGDRVAHPEVHGGRDQAVYAYAREDLDHWSAELGREIPDGMFGENLTTEGIDVNDALVGERWRIGEALFEVAKVRIPCNTFKGWMGESGFDNTAWVKRFTLANRPGPYLRVLEEGVIRAGDAIDVVRRPEHGLTVSFMFRALTTERQLAPELLRIDSLATSLREWVERHS